MSSLAYITIFTLASSILSLAGGVILILNKKWGTKFAIHILSYAAGALLGAAFIDVMPEALELTRSKTGSEPILITVLIGIIGFFVLEQTIIKFHTHSLQHEGKNHAHDSPAYLVTIGDAFHNFIDGVAIAGAFIVSIPLGITTSLAVAAHEIPQEIGDFAVMICSGWGRIKVIVINLLVSLTSIIGALLTYWARDEITPYIPYILAVTAASFIYIATADLIPQLAKEKSDKPSHVVFFLLLGVVTIWLSTKLINGL